MSDFFYYSELFYKNYLLNLFKLFNLITNNYLLKRFKLSINTTEYSKINLRGIFILNFKFLNYPTVLL